MHTSTALSIKLLRAPDPKLRTILKPVKKITPALGQTCRQMIKLTKTFVDPEGIGLAANQIGLGERFFVAKMGPSKKGQFKAYVNPQILSLSKKTKKYFEGCLSIPSYWGEVKRSTSIKVSFQDETGKSHQATFKGNNAWVFQHEMDHLDGVIFPDRVLQQKGRFFKHTGKDSTGQDVYQEMTL